MALHILTSKGDMVILWESFRALAIWQGSQDGLANSDMKLQLGDLLDEGN